MAAPNGSPARLGQLNTDTSKPLELFNDVLLSSEVITAFEENNVLMPLIWNRTITHGKSASFPMIGKATASYHTAGTYITGQAINKAEQTITIDGKLLSAVEIDDLDTFMSEVEYRGPFTQELGRSLADQMDINISLELVKAARAAHAVTGLDSGTEIKNDKFIVNASGSADLEEKAVALAEGLLTAAQTLDEKKVPKAGRVAAFRPAEYYSLMRNTDLLNREFGGVGSMSMGEIPMFAGIRIIETNNVPKANVQSSDNAYHYVDASKTVGLVWCPQAVAVVKLMDMSFEAGWDMRTETWLLKSKMAVGIGTVNPTCAVELKLDSLSNA